VTLSGGTIQLNSGLTETLGTLSLTSTSTIDFQNLGGTVNFAATSSAWTSGTILNVYNWTQGTDHLFFGSSASGLAAGDLAEIRLWTDGGTTSAGTAQINNFGEVVVSIVPEPSALFVGLGLCSLVGYRERRWFLRCRAARQKALA
jgi:hypothetical protein